MELDVALVPAVARTWHDTVCVVIDELRASSTITAILDGGCSRLFVTGGLGVARRLGREHDALLAGERHGYAPKGFDYDNSPSDLSRADLRDRVVVLSTSNGTRVLERVSNEPAVLVGCLLNARACAEAAVELAGTFGRRIGLVCAGTHGVFALDDAVAAGAIAERVVEAARGREADIALSESAVAAIQLRGSYPDLESPLRDSTAGRLLARLGSDYDVPFCARLDVTRTVGLLRPGPILSIERFAPASTTALATASASTVPIAEVPAGES